MYKKCIAMFLVASLSYANGYFQIGKNDFFSTSKRGWHYYEKDDANKSVTNPEKKKTQRDIEDEEFMSSIPINNLDILSAQEFTASFEKARQIAVMKPTKENVFIVQKMNKWQTEQSEKFAIVWQLNYLENPSLEFPEILSDKLGRNDTLQKKNKEIKEFFATHKDNLAFAVFMSKLNENTNMKQIDIYNSIQREYEGVEVVYVDIDERIDLITPLKLETTPDNFFVYKNKKGEAIFKRIKAGLANKDEIIRNTMFLFENAILEEDK